MTINAIRAALRSAFGVRKYRITKNGEVHVYGPLPNAIHMTGWYFYGYVGDAQTEAHIKTL